MDKSCKLSELIVVGRSILALYDFDITSSFIFAASSTFFSILKASTILLTFSRLLMTSSWFCFSFLAVTSNSVATSLFGWTLKSLKSIFLLSVFTFNSFKFEHAWRYYCRLHNEIMACHDFIALATNSISSVQLHSVSLLRTESDQRQSTTHDFCTLITKPLNQVNIVSKTYRNSHATAL